MSAYTPDASRGYAHEAMPQNGSNQYGPSVGMNTMVGSSSSNGNLRAAREAAAARNAGYGAKSANGASGSGSNSFSPEHGNTFAQSATHQAIGSGQDRRRADASPERASRMPIQKPYVNPTANRTRIDTSPSTLRRPQNAASPARHAQVAQASGLTAAAPHYAMKVTPSYYVDDDDDEEKDRHELTRIESNKKYKQELERKKSHARRALTPDDDYEDIYGHYAELDPGTRDSALPYQGPAGHRGPRQTQGNEIGFDSLSTAGSPSKEQGADKLERNSSNTTSVSRWLPGRGNSTASRTVSTKHGQHTRGKSSTLERALPAPLLSSPTAARFGWLPRTWATRIFLLVTLAESAADISIEAVLLSRFRRDQGSFHNEGGTLEALPVFLMVFGFAHVYQCFLAVDAVINRNTILVMGLVVFNLAFFVYAIIQITEIRDVLGDGIKKGSSETVPVQVLTGAIPVIIGVASIILTATAWFLMKEFGWQVYKTIGADRRLKRAHLHYQIFVCLLKFDFFMFIAFCLQLVLVVLRKETAEYWITMLAAPVALVLLFFAWHSVRQEIRWGMVVFMIGLVGGAVYFAYKLFRVWQQHATTYQDVYKSLTVFSVLALILLGATIVMSIRCMMNFGRGLKVAMSRSAEEKKRSKIDDQSGPVEISAPYQARGPGGVVMGTNYPPLQQYDSRVPITSPPYGGHGTSPGGAGAFYMSPTNGGAKAGRGEPVDYFDVYSGGAGLGHTPSSNGAHAQVLPASTSTKALLSPTSPPALGMPMSASLNAYGNGAGMHRNPSNTGGHAHMTPLDRYDSRSLAKNNSANRLSLD